MIFGCKIYTLNEEVVDFVSYTSSTMAVRKRFLTHSSTMLSPCLRESDSELSTVTCRLRADTLLSLFLVDCLTLGLGIYPRVY